VARVSPNSVEALKAGEADLAVVFTASPYVEDSDLVVAADKEVIGADQVVPLHRHPVDQLFDGRLRPRLDEVSELVTSEGLGSKRCRDAKPAHESAPGPAGAGVGRP
jgi:hypothetical protein